MKEKDLLYKNMAQTWCLRHKLFALILGMQALVLLYFVARLFAPKVIVDVPLDAFVSAESSIAVSYTEDGLLIQNPENVTDGVMVVAPAISLPTGAYKMHVFYESSADATTPTYDINEFSIGVYCGSIQTPIPISNYGLVLLLRDSAQQLDAYLWSGLQSSEQTLMLYYTGTGYNKIISMQIEEQISWRYFILLTAGLCFALFDFLVYCGCELIRRKRMGLPARKGERTRATHCPKWAVLLCLLAITLLASLPLFAKGLWDIDDIHFHLTRIAAIAAELANVQFPVRMLTEMSNGYSYPTSLFYCDVFLYIPAILYNCMVPLQMAYKIYAALIAFCTASVAYCCFTRLAKDARIGMIGAMLYTLSTYRLSNVYSRGAVGEYTAMLFLPLVLLGVWQIYQSEKLTWRDWLPLALGMAGIVQSHVLSVQIVVSFLALFCIVAYRKTFVLVRFKALALATLLCMGLSAWFWVPFVESMLTISIEAFVKISSDISVLGMTLAQMFSFQGYELPERYVRGYLGWALLIGVASAIVCLLCRKKWNISSTTIRSLGVLVAFGAFASLISLQVFPWGAIANDIHPYIGTITNTIQFPWRYLMLATVCFVGAAVVALGVIKQRSAQGYRALVMLLLTFTWLTTGLYYYTSVTTMDIEPLSWTYLECADTMRTGNGEYFIEGTGYADAYVASVQTSSDALVVQAYQKVDGVAQITLENTSSQAQTVTLPIWNYPNYQATDAESGIVYAITTGERNCVQLTIEAGYAGIIQVAYVSPWYWHLAEGVTLLCWAFVLVTAVKTRKEKRLVDAV